MVPTWRQLIFVTCNWGSYLVCPFSHLRCGILFCVSAYVRFIFHDRYVFVVLEVKLSLKCGTLLTLRLGPIIHTMVVTTGLFYKVIESGVGGKTYDIIKPMYTGNTCSIKIDIKRTEFFNQGRGLCQGCNLSPALFNIYINELATTLKKSSVPDVSLHISEVKNKFLFSMTLYLVSSGI